MSLIQDILAEEITKRGMAEARLVLADNLAEAVARILDFEGCLCRWCEAMRALDAYRARRSDG